MINRGLCLLVTCALLVQQLFVFSSAAYASDSDHGHGRHGKHHKSKNYRHAPVAKLTTFPHQCVSPCMLFASGAHSFAKKGKQIEKYILTVGDKIYHSSTPDFQIPLIHIDNGKQKKKHTHYDVQDIKLLLTVVDSDGVRSKNRVKKEVHVEGRPNTAPTISLNVSAASFYNPADVTFDLSGSTDLESDIASYIISYGDGTSGTGAVQTHRYPNSGIFQAVAKITDRHGGVTEKTHTLEILHNDPPVAKISVTPLAEKGRFRLDASASSDADGMISNFSWGLPGGASASGAVVEAMFPVGSSLAELSVTDNRNAQATTSASIFVPADENSGGGLAGVDSSEVGVAPGDIQITPSNIAPPDLIEGVFKPISEVVEIHDINHPGGVVYPSGHVRLQFKYDPAKLLAENLLPNFMAFFQDTDLTWKRVSFVQVDEANHIVYAFTNHLTPFVLTALTDIQGPQIALEYFDNNFPGIELRFKINDNNQIDYSRLSAQVNGHELESEHLAVDALTNTVAIQFSEFDPFVLFGMYNTLTIKVPDQNQNLGIKGMAFKVEEMPESPVRFSFDPGGGELSTTTPVVRVSMNSEMALNFSTFEARLNNLKIPASLISINSAAKEATITLNPDFALSTTNFSILTVQISTTLGQQASGLVGFDTINRNVQVLVGANTNAANGGSNHTCAVLSNGGVRCFGDNSFGQLGYPGLSNVGLTITPESVGDVVLGAPAKKIVTGAKHTCALLTSGEVRCFGDASFGKLGVGATLGTQTKIGDDELPTAIGKVSLGTVAIDLVAGREHTCAILQNLTVRCWGLGTSGQLGMGVLINVGDDELPSSVPAANLQPSPVLKIVAGAFHTCALNNQGIFCTGENSLGQLGLGDTNNRASFTDLNVPALAGEIREISAGAFHTCISGTTSSQFFCWGEGSYNKLGRGNQNIGDDESPFMGANLDSNIRELLDQVFGATGEGHQLALGDNHTCIRGIGGEVACIGRSDLGALGGVPGPEGFVLVDLGAPAKKIFAGSNHTCAVLGSNNLKCWGQGAFGELGLPGITSIGVENTPSDFSPISLGGPVNVDVINPITKSTLAAFNVSPQFGNAPLAVHFDGSQSLSTTGEIVRYFWNPGDSTNAPDPGGGGGGPSQFETTQPFFDYTYSNPGLFFAHLRVENSEGEQDNTVRLVNVSEAPATARPIAVITADNDIGVAPFSVNFSGALSTTPIGSIVNYAWNFGLNQGQTSTSNPDIAYVFNEAGTFVVQLKVTNSEGVESLINFLVIVTTPANEIPVAKFNCTKNDKTFTCDASASFDLDSIVTDISWNMGDGTILNGPQIQYTYAQGGEFDLEVKVFDQDGNVGTQVKRIIAGPVPPQILAFECGPTPDPRRVQCFLNALAREAQILTTTIDWGDGSAQEFPFEDGAAGTGLSHDYATGGDFHITATVRDFANLTAMAETDIVINTGGGTGGTGTLASPEDFQFRCAPDPRLIGVNQSSECSLVTAPTASMQISAELQSGEQFFGPSFTLNFTDVGANQLNFDFSFMNGARVNFNIPITVQAQDAPGMGALNLNPGDMSCHLNGRVASCNATQNTPVFGSLQTASWTFFDGVVDNFLNGAMATFEYDLSATSGRIIGQASYAPMPTALPIIETQEFGVSFDSGGGSNFPPVAVINCSVAGSGNVNCDANSSLDSDGQIISYLWEVQELGLTQIGPMFSFNLPAGMQVTVRLAVVDDDGASAMAMQQIGSGGGCTGIGCGGHNLPPVAEFYCQTGYQGNPLTIECFADETLDPENQLASLRWDLGDGTIATKILTAPTGGGTQGPGGELEDPNANPFLSARYIRYTYATDGNYTIDLRGTDEQGLFGQISHSYDVGNVEPENLPPVALLSCFSPAPLIISCDPWGSFDPDGYITLYEIKIGAMGAFQQYPIPENISVPDAGDYEITLRVTDFLGAQAISLPIIVHVNENQAPIAMLSCQVEDPQNNPFHVSCNLDGTTDSDGTISYMQINWNNEATYQVGFQADFNFQNGGAKLITLLVRDNNSAETSISTTVNLNSLPVAAFTCFHIKALTIKCDASASTDDGSITSYAWNLNGTLKTGAVITQEYLNEQSGVIDLTVTDNNGLQNTLSQIFFVQLNPDIKLPVADFEHSIDANNLVHFDAEASLFDGRIITKYSWNLGNGETRETTVPTLDYSYPEQGRRTVGLVVTDQNDVASTLLTQEIRVYTPSIADPSFAGEQTLEGTDADNDGLRDDLQRWIDEYYGDKQNERNGLRQIAKTIYGNLLEVPELLNTKNRSVQEILDFRCLMASFTNADEATRASNQLKAINYNTYDRLARFAEIETLLKTSPLNVPNADFDQFKNECQFEILPEGL